MSDKTQVLANTGITQMAVVPTPTPPLRKRKLLETLADKYGVEPAVFRDTMAAVAMPKEHSREELISCLIVANEHDLNPLTKEIHFMRPKQGGIQPIVGVDGWIKKMNEHPQFDGVEFEYERGGEDGKELVACTAKIYRKDRSKPTVVTEYMSECFRRAPEGKPNAWSLTPMRMLRHRALIQGIRYAMGFAGVMDYDEYQAWQESLRDVTPADAAAPLEIPDDIPNETVEAEVVSEAEASQDAGIENPGAYLVYLKETLEDASNEKEFQTTWAAHVDEREARLDAEYQKRAREVYAKVAKARKFQTKD